MPFPANTTTILTLDGVSYSAQYADTGNGFEGVTASPLSGKPGSVTAPGVVTFAAPSFLTDGFLDLFWSGGSRRKESATFAGEVCTLGNVGTLDPLPPVGTAVLASPSDGFQVVSSIDGAKILAAGATGTQPGHVTFLAAGGAGPDVTFRIRTPNDGPSWSKSSGVANPFTAVNYTAVSFTAGGPVQNTAADMRAGVALQ